MTLFSMQKCNDSVVVERVELRNSIEKAAFELLDGGTCLQSIPPIMLANASELSNLKLLPGILKLTYGRT